MLDGSFSNLKGSTLVRYDSYWIDFVAMVKSVHSPARNNPKDIVNLRYLSKNYFRVISDTRYLRFSM